MIKDLGKLPKRKVSVSELLDLDDINEIKAWLNDITPNIQECVIVVSLEDGTFECSTSKMPNSRVIYLLELAKNHILNKSDAE